MTEAAFIAGVGMTQFGKQPDVGLKHLTGQAVDKAVRDSGVLQLDDIEVAFFGNAVAGSITGQEMVKGQVCLRAAGIHSIPIYNVENACASSSTALNLAYQAVASGTAQVALAVGAEKMTHPDKARSLAVIAGAMDVEVAADKQEFSPVGRSVFMDLYAEQACRYMERTGATPEDFANIAAKNHGNGALNPLAQYGSRTTAEAVLASREIAWPLTLLMCSPISDGAAAAIVVSESVRRRIDHINPRVAASVVASGSPEGTLDKSSSKAIVRAASRAYELASLGPEDLDLAEVHDAAAPAELFIYEELGLASPGEGPGLIRQRTTHLGGRLPVNPSGGLLARGHPIGATGLGQVYELVQQLRGRAGERQVEGARIGLAQNSGGWLDGDNAVTVVTILSI